MRAKSRPEDEPPGGSFLLCAIYYFTVSVTITVYTVPAAFVILQRYWKPFRAAVAGTETVAVFAPVSVLLYQVPVLPVRYCHW